MPLFGAPPYPFIDSGLIGDNVTDNSATLQALINTYKATQNAVWVRPGNYLLTTTITIDHIMNLWCAPGCNFRYTGAAEAFLITSTATYERSNLIFDTIQTTGTYGVRITGVNGTIALLNLSIRKISGSTSAALRIEGGGVSLADINIGELDATAGGYGFYAQNGAVAYESNRIHVGLIAGGTLTTQGWHIESNWLGGLIDFDCDLGLSGVNHTAPKAFMDGQLTTIIPRAWNPGSVNASPPDAVFWFGSNSLNNHLVCPPKLLQGLVDDAPPGANVYPGVRPPQANVLQNGSFAWWTNATTPKDWAILGGATISRTATDVKDGPFAAILNANSNTFAGLTMNVTTAIVGSICTLCGWAKAAATNVAVPSIYVDDGAGGHVVEVQVPSDGHWHFIVLQFTAFANPRIDLFASHGVANTDTLQVSGLRCYIGQWPCLPVQEPVVASPDFLVNTSATMNNGAAAQAGTLTNAPSAGNPTKWIPVNDNGTTRFIPAW